MRQVTIVMPPEHSDRVTAESERHDISILAELDARRDGKRQTMIICNSPNAKIEGFLSALEEVEGLHITFAPQGVLALRPPADEPEDQVTNVQFRSPLEVFLSGLQSIGSWTGFLSYAAVGAVIVWIGLYTESIFLLVAAMLIAPFAGPAMTLALATARGDAHLMRQSLVRYVAALSTAIAVAALLSFLFDQTIATPLMISTSMRSTVSVLLPLAAGAAGALNLVQSERSSLVSGAATGMLVAAALAPPAGLIGMGLVINQMDIVMSSLWALAIQIVGINLSGFLVFRFCGINSRGARYPRGKPFLTVLATVLSLAALAALLFVQFSSTPEYQQSSISQRISAVVQQDIEQRDGIGLVMVQSTFTRSRPQGENPVWITVHVQAEMSDAEKAALTQQLDARVEREFGVEALVQLSAAS